MIMGWFGSSAAPPSPAAPKPSQDGGFIAPDRSQRAVCWDTRDAFFRCLDRAGIVDSVREDAKARDACAPELKEFEKACASSWVTYFKKRRVMEHQRELTLKKLAAEGAQVPENVGGSVAATVLKGR